MIVCRWFVQLAIIIMALVFAIMHLCEKILLCMSVPFFTFFFNLVSINQME